MSDLLFNLQAGYDKAEVKAEFKRLCKIHHPDVGGSKEVFQQVQVQYEWLMQRAVEKRPKPIDTSKLYHRITDGYPRDVNVEVTRDMLDEGCTILHMFTRGPETVYKLNVPSGANFGMTAKAGPLRFTLVEQRGIW